MKKILSLTLFSLLVLSMSAFARVQYDSTGRYVVEDNTIRGQRKAQEAKAQTERKIQAAAAAKIDYENALRELNQGGAKGYKPVQTVRYYNVR